MQYGALRQKEIDAAFYIRQSPKENISQSNVSNEHPHLTRLKDSIVKNKHVHSSSYASLEQLGDLVYNDLKAVMDAEFPADKDQQQLREHERSFRSHLTNYADLSNYHKQIEAALGRLNSEHRFLAIHGLKGAGKSTVLCTFIDQYQKSHDADILYYDMAKVPLGQEINIHTIFNGQIRKKESPDPALNFLITPLGYLSFSKSKERILALDNVEYLPPELHEYFIRLLIMFNDDPNIKIIITHTDYEFNPYHTSEEDMTYSYISIENLKAEKVEVHGIPREDIPIFVKRYLKQFGKSLTPQQLEQFKTPHYTENPHYLIMALYQLVEFGVFEKIQNEIDCLTENSDYDKRKREKNTYNYMSSISTPVIYTLDNVITREVGDNGEPNRISMVFYVLFTLSRVYGGGFTEQEIIEIFSFTPIQWALFRPQVMLICRIQNGEIIFNDHMFDYILGHAQENVDLTFDKVIQHFENIPWLYELEEEFSSQKYKRFLSEADKVRAKRSFRKAQVLPIFLFHRGRYQQLQTYFNDPKIRKNIPADDVKWLEKRLQEKLKTSK